MSEKQVLILPSYIFKLSLWNNNSNQPIMQHLTKDNALQLFKKAIEHKRDKQKEIEKRYASQGQTVNVVLL